jgi:hypothetical protein
VGVCMYVRAYVFLRADEDAMVSASDCGCEEILGIVSRVFWVDGCFRSWFECMTLTCIAHAHAHTLMMNKPCMYMYACAPKMTFALLDARDCLDTHACSGDHVLRARST